MSNLDVKGQHIKQGTGPDFSQGAMEKHLYGIERGPRMLPRKTRFKVWGALFFFGSWCVGSYSLIAYRLRSDDLELMEREVYEELEKKKEVEKLMNQKLSSV